MTSPLVSVVKAKLRAEGHFVLTLRGRCMEPLLLEGDKAFVELTDDVRIGDLALVLLDDGSLAVHRVVAVDQGAVVTKGDYSGKSEKLGSSRVLGVAREFSLDGGSWVADPRSESECAELAALSAIIGKESGNAESESARVLIWNLNQAARREMMEGAIVAMNRLAYSKPDLHYWTAEQLDSVEATMSGGGGWIPTVDYVAVYLLFSPIVIEGFDTSLDHAAFFLERSDGSGLFYSFASDTDNGLALVNGCDGRLSTCVNTMGASISITLQSVMECNVNGSPNFKSDLMEINNDPPFAIKANDAPYYRYLKIPISGFAFHEQIGNGINDNALDIRNTNNSNPRQYSLLWSNCCDCALECLRETDRPITIDYDNTNAVAMAAAVAAAMTLSPIGLIRNLGIALSARLLVEGAPTIPNLVYDEVAAVSVDGQALGTTGYSKCEYRARPL